MKLTSKRIASTRSDILPKMLVARRSGKGVKAQRKVYILANGRETFIGYIFEPDGKGAGYRYRLPFPGLLSEETYPSIKAAKNAMGAKL